VCWLCWGLGYACTHTLIQHPAWAIRTHKRVSCRRLSIKNNKQVLSTRKAPQRISMYNTHPTPRVGYHNAQKSFVCDWPLRAINRCCHCWKAQLACCVYVHAVRVAAHTIWQDRHTRKHVRIRERCVLVSCCRCRSWHTAWRGCDCFFLDALWLNGI